MNEADTRRELIDPKIKEAGWGVVEGSLVGFLSLNGIEFHLATAMVVFIRFFTRWIGVMAGFIGLKFSNILSN